MDYIVHGVAKSRTQLSDFHVTGLQADTIMGLDSRVPWKGMGVFGMQEEYELSGARGHTVVARFQSSPQGPILHGIHAFA